MTDARTLVIAAGDAAQELNLAKAREEEARQALDSAKAAVSEARQAYDERIAECEAAGMAKAAARKAAEAINAVFSDLGIAPQAGEDDRPADAPKPKAPAKKRRGKDAKEEAAEKADAPSAAEKAPEAENAPAPEAEQAKETAAVEAVEEAPAATDSKIVQNEAPAEPDADEIAEVVGIIREYGVAQHPSLEARCAKAREFLERNAAEVAKKLAASGSGFGLAEFAAWHSEPSVCIDADTARAINWLCEIAQFLEKGGKGEHPYLFEAPAEAPAETPGDGQPESAASAPAAENAAAASDGLEGGTADEPVDDAAYGEPDYGDVSDDVSFEADGADPVEDIGEINFLDEGPQDEPEPSKEAAPPAEQEKPAQAAPKTAPPAAPKFTPPAFLK